MGDHRGASNGSADRGGVVGNAVLFACALAAAAASTGLLPALSSGGGGSSCSDPDIKGTRGKDRLIGTNARETIAGLGGNDFINGKSGPDVICGDAGNDGILGGSGDDRINGGPGSDQINGEGGSDLLQDPGTNSSGDQIVGEAGDDTFKVGEKDGFCRCIGGDGKDRMFSLMKYGPDPGEVGSVFRGNRAIDTIFANGTITGDEEDDKITTGSRPKGMVVDSNDHVSGGRGDDIITPVRDTGEDEITGDDGLDDIVANGGDTVSGGRGEDEIATKASPGGPVTIDGGDSVDVISVVGALTALVFGGGQGDTIDASLSKLAVVLHGDAGPDTLIGGGADDQLFGGTERDSLSGRAAHDICDGGSEPDTVDATCEETPNVP